MSLDATRAQPCIGITPRGMPLQDSVPEGEPGHSLFSGDGPGVPRVSYRMPSSTGRMKTG